MGGQKNNKLILEYFSEKNNENVIEFQYFGKFLTIVFSHVCEMTNFHLK